MLHFDTCIWMLVFILGSLTSVCLFCVIRKRTKLQRIKYINQVNKFKIINIRNRLSPHLAFNVLSREMQFLDVSQKQRLCTLTHLLRESLLLTDKNFIKLSEEINFVTQFVSLYDYKDGEDVSLIWNISPDIKAEEFDLFPMMLQIPIENAIKHGLSLVDGEKRIVIDVTKEKNRTYIRIQDNGLGYNLNRRCFSSGTGSGLKILNQIIHVLNTNNVEEMSVSIRNIDSPNETGTLVEYYILDGYNFII
ncbi:MAG: hypothetical protein EOM31_07690 [Bacteroidia bacterium]|nr:hypothetical protein [Bacteroidia bacterium]